MKYATAVVACAAFTLSARAQISYLSGVQTNTGFVRHQSFDISTQSYNQVAPDQAGSWNPAPQNLLASLGGSDRAVLNTSWTSTLAPDLLTWNAHTTEARTAAFNGDSTFQYDKTFDIQFTFSQPTLVRVSANIQRNNGGWPTGTPFSLSFGPLAGPTVFDFAATPNIPINYTGDFPETELLLGAGTYRVRGLNHADWSGGRSGSNHTTDTMNFSLRVVPSPMGASILLGGLGACLTQRRRRVIAQTMH